MSVSISGIDRLINKLNKLDKVQGKKAVETVAKTVETAIKAGASWSNRENCIQKCDTREYETSYFVDIGIKSSLGNWEDGKVLFFHNYGYWQKYYGRPTGKFTNVHVNWFNQAVANIEGPTVQKIKEELRQEIRNILEG